MIARVRTKPLQATLLGRKLLGLKERMGMGLGDLTVLSNSNDPFRLDTPANHKKAKWLQDMMQQCGLLDRPGPIHGRGIYYTFMSHGRIRLPSGERFQGNFECYVYVVEASKTARWLGYVPFEKISDERNEAPVIRVHEHEHIRSGVHIAAGTFLWPDFTNINLAPEAWVSDVDVQQPYRIVLCGE